VASIITEEVFLVRRTQGTQANAFSYQPEYNNNWTKMSCQRARSTHEETQREAKHNKGREHWLNQTSTSNRYTALLEEEHKTDPENTSKPPQINITDVKNISPLIRLLDQTPKQQ
jgi:hypothetical protein